MELISNVRNIKKACVSKLSFASWLLLASIILLLLHFVQHGQIVHIAPENTVFRVPWNQQNPSVPIHPLANHAVAPVSANFSYWCDDLFTDYSADRKSDLYEEKLADFRYKLSTLGTDATKEGSSGGLAKQARYLHYLARAPGVTTICETGFNIGYSAYSFLTASPNITLHSFDILQYRGSKIMAMYLTKMFPGRFHLHAGNSTATLYAFRKKQHPKVKCDIVLVDGGHSGSVPYYDLLNFLKMSVVGKTIVLYDDYPSSVAMDFVRLPELGGAWELVKHRGLVKELFRCAFKSTLFQEWERGFTVGVVMDEGKHG